MIAELIDRNDDRLLRSLDEEAKSIRPGLPPAGDGRHCTMTMTRRNDMDNLDWRGLRWNDPQGCRVS